MIGRGNEEATHHADACVLLLPRLTANRAADTLLRGASCVMNNAWTCCIYLHCFLVFVALHLCKSDFIRMHPWRIKTVVRGSSCIEKLCSFVTLIDSDPCKSVFIRFHPC